MRVGVKQKLKMAVGIFLCWRGLDGAAAKVVAALWDTYLGGVRPRFIRRCST